MQRIPVCKQKKPNKEHLYAILLNADLKKMKLILQNHFRFHHQTVLEAQFLFVPLSDLLLNNNRLSMSL